MASSIKLNLDDDQMFALMKFRRSVHDIMEPHHDDQFLLRWLRARSWNAEAAEKMLRASIEWRKEWDIDDGLKSWTPPEPLASYYPSGLSGYDKGKAPVYIVPIGNLDVVGLLHSVSRQDLIRLTIQILEKTLEMARKTGSNQVVAIFDLENFILKPYTWRPAVELVISLLQMYEANYPEILKICFVINAPTVFALAFSVIKKFIHEYTLNKIKIYKTDPKKWQQALREYIDDDNLPKHYGGGMIDPDGNPRCPSKIRQGGKVPKSYYKRKLTDEHLAEKKEYTTIVIKKGKKLTLDYLVAEEGCFLKWDFRTEDHDIRFGVTCVDEEGNVHPAVRHSRISANQLDVSGALACKAPATYTVTFDNTYSLLRGKKLHYSIYVTDPITKLEIDTSNETENLNGKLSTTYATNDTLRNSDESSQL